MPFQEEDFTVNWQAEEEGGGLPDSGPSEGGDDDSYEQSGGDGDYLSVELDDDHNEGKTTFCPGDDAYITVFHSPGQDVTINAAIGNIKKLLSSVPVEIEESVNCDNSSSVNLKYEPNGNINIVWSPPVSSAYTIDGRTVTLASPVFSIATITYETLTDVLMLNGISETTEIRVLANMGDVTSAMTVSFLCDSEDTPDGEEDEIAITTAFCDTGNPVSGVQVWINNVYQGSSNSQGIVNIGLRTIGDVVTARWKNGSDAGEIELTL